MELEFRPVQIPCLHCVLYETVTQEVRGEVPVPEDAGDPTRIIGALADAVVRTRQCGNGELSLNGDVQACVLLEAADRPEPLTLSVYLPFTLGRSVAPEATSCAVRCRVAGAEAQLLGARKAGVRVVLHLTLWAWAPREQTCFRPEGRDRRVQLRLREYPMRLVRECAQKTMLLRDTLPLAAGAPEAARIVHTRTRCEISDAKLSGSQAVCKGTLHLSLLYETPAGELCAGELAMPFSQLIDLAGSYDEQSAEILPQLTAAEALAEDGGVAVEAGIELQCIVRQTVAVPIVEDAYALRGELQTRTQSVELTPMLDIRTLRQDLAPELPGRAREILAVDVFPGTPQIESRDGACRIRAPVQICLLYRDETGACRRAEGSACFEQQVSAAPALCRAEAGIEGTVFAAPGAGRIELRIPVAVHARWYDERPRQSICAAQLREGPREERPAVVIRTLEADAPLWDIAKELRTTVSAIQIANDMDADVAPAGMMLLIPIVA